MGVELGVSQRSGDSRRDGGLCAGSSDCVESPAGAESLSVPVSCAGEMPALWHSFGGV